LDADKKADRPNELNLREKYSNNKLGGNSAKLTF
jgi:hypothetical protein